MKSLKHVISKPSGINPLALAGIGLSCLAAINWLVCRQTERRHPPQASFMTVNGIKLHYSDRGRGSPVVLIHGNAVTGDDWNTSGVAEHLIQSHRVIIFDRPGCGYSERPRGRRWTADQQAELFHAALQQLGIERPVIVGHSLGTIIALSYATRYQAETAALVLLAGYYFWTVRPDVLLAMPTALPVIGDLLRYTVSPLFSWLQSPLLKKAIFSPAPVTKRFQKEYVPAMVARPSQIRATSVDGVSIIEWVLKLRSRYKQLELPITIIAGSGDKIVLPDNSRRLHAELGYSTLKIIKSAGHMVHHSATDAVVDAIEDIMTTDQLSAAVPV